MSQLTHPRIQTYGLSKRLRTWLAIAALVAVVAVPVVLAITLSDDSTPSHQTIPQAAGLRFDGGPDEGTRGEPRQAAGTRFDGGPDEGTRGEIANQSPHAVQKSAGQDTTGARP